MAEIIEGEWKEFVFKMAKPEDEQRILNLLRTSFYPHETLCSLMCKGSEEALDLLAQGFAPIVKSILSQYNLSFLVEHKTTKRIAGVRITALASKGDTEDESSSFEYRPCEIILNFLAKASAQVDMFAVYPDVDRYADFFMTAVSDEFRGQGLATEMYNRAIQLFQANGIRLCKSVLTSPYTRMACKRLNFTEHCSLYLKDYKDVDGNQHYPNVSPDEFITVVSKRI